ncbi:hypothetical protein [Streptomyces sp. Isolate_45]|uniref:hypothetical protein n=1 Tax=Streptomyces sp. Isolate_45 TaxID=2950111 RepID=UPI002481DF19|nr:hypothetical protein [Streptomyces sp. Isolate_45]MDA5281708.1 hypothetical protein [Streptomyces sp. Isolate_45]
MRETYGHGLHAARYETPAAGPAPIDGAVPLRPQGRTLIAADGNAVLPIRRAKRDLPATAGRLPKAYDLRTDLIRRHGPKPTRPPLDLGTEGPDEEHVHPDAASSHQDRSSPR